MHSDNGRVDHLNGCVVRCGQRPQHSVPDTSPPPPDEAIVGGSIWTKASRQVAPRCAGAQDPENAIQDTAVIYSRYASWLIRQQRLDGEPLVVGEFVAHDVKLHFRGLEIILSHQRR